jgi:hypothetical protein
VILLSSQYLHPLALDTKAVSAVNVLGSFPG